MRGFLSHALGPLSTIESTLIQFKNPAKDIKTLNFNDEWFFWFLKIAIQSLLKEILLKTVSEKGKN